MLKIKQESCDRHILLLVQEGYKYILLVTHKANKSKSILGGNKAAMELDGADLGLERSSQSKSRGPRTPHVDS